MPIEGFKKPNLENGESADEKPIEKVESAEAKPLMTKEQAEEAIQGMPDFGDVQGFAIGELEKVKAAEEAGIPVEEGLKEYLEKEEAEARQNLIP